MAAASIPARDDGLNPRPRPGITGLNRSIPMLALGIILGFVVLLGVINFIEFGRVD